MTFAAHWRRAPLHAAALAALVALVGAVPAAADCLADLTASQQNLERTRAGADAANAGPEAQKCAAHRRHYAAMVKVRDVFARCDTGAKKAERAVQLKASIDDFRAKMPRGCRP
jgi:hypothetical protein